MFNKITTLALLGLFPFSWTAPLAAVEHALSTETYSIISTIQKVAADDLFLAIVVLIFGVVTPYVKLLLCAYVQLSDAPLSDVSWRLRMMPVIHQLGRFAMMDVFLVAIIVAGYSGFFSDFTAQWGVYFFVSLVIASLAFGVKLERDLKRVARRSAQTTS